VGSALGKWLLAVLYALRRAFNTLKQQKEGNPGNLVSALRKPCSRNCRKKRCRSATEALQVGQHRLRSHGHACPLTAWPTAKRTGHAYGTQCCALAAAAYSPGGMLIDLIGFSKQVNDQLGHETGDQVFAHYLAKAIAQYRQGSDFVARLGGRTNSFLQKKWWPRI